MANPSWWTKQVYPRLLDRVCSTRAVEQERGRWLTRASGHVLEIGVGSGLSLPYFAGAAPQVSTVTGVDPSLALLSRASERARQLSLTFTAVPGVAEALPFVADRFDTVVFAYALCSVDAPRRALAEAHRVLAPGGRLLFVEHGLAQTRPSQWLQQSLTPGWRLVAGNCHLDRNVLQLLTEAGFLVEEMDSRSVGLLSHAYSGFAIKRR